MKLKPGAPQPIIRQYSVPAFRFVRELHLVKFAPSVRKRFVHYIDVSKGLIFDNAGSKRI